MASGALRRQHGVHLALASTCSSGISRHIGSDPCLGGKAMKHHAVSPCGCPPIPSSFPTPSSDFALNQSCHASAQAQMVLLGWSQWSFGRRSHWPGVLGPFDVKRAFLENPERFLRSPARKALSTDPIDRKERMDCKDCIEPPRFSCGCRTTPVLRSSIDRFATSWRSTLRELWASECPQGHNG